MLLILEEYFKDHPIKKRIVEGLYRRGISVANSKFYSDGIEITISEVAKTFRVNRRTVYDTIRLIEESPAIKTVMSKLLPAADISRISPLMGDQVVTVSISPGYFSKTMSGVMDVAKRYGSYVKEIYGRNMIRNEVFLRAIIHHTVPRKIFEEMSKIEGVQKILIETSGTMDEDTICSKCEVKLCPSKLSSELFDETLAEI
ncbi:MAG: regulator [Candidatus Thermoplasmatota archaeon]|jgi:predicted regulator of amino acid metabolism with ACT domain|nr:regulator [Candidatus Thermoplasmatota archaeon]